MTSGELLNITGADLQRGDVLLCPELGEIADITDEVWHRGVPQGRRDATFHGAADLTDLDLSATFTILR